MQLQYHLHYRDELEAASARFPGDPPAAAPRPGVGLLLLALVATLTGLLLLLSRGRATPALWDTLAQADRINHPVFVAGVLLVAVGGAMYFVPLTYLLGVRRSARPLHDDPVTLVLDDDGLTLEGPAKKLRLAWSGVAAFSETKRVFVLKTLGDLRLALPKRALDTPERADALRELLRLRVLPLAQARPPAQSADWPASTYAPPQDGRVAA
jgi:hypothetical protein